MKPDKIMNIEVLIIFLHIIGCKPNNTISIVNTTTQTNLKNFSVDYFKKLIY